MIKIFVGTDRSQLLATEVLRHSILSTCSKKVDVIPLDKVSIPEPKDIRQSQRTGFSFARWAIPEVCNYKGKGIYLDADMLVFSDISNLWDIEMNNAVIALVDGRNDSFTSSGVKLTKNESSVFVLNCERANWTLKDVVNGLDGQYTYKQMMSDLCFLDEGEISRSIPRSWNSMDYWDENVDLVHFTNVPTQPWVSLDNPYGYVWVNYLKKMIHDKSISIDKVKKEIELGYIRPSLESELVGETAYLRNNEYLIELKKIDKQASYIPHKEVQDWNKKRETAIYKYEKKLARNNGLVEYLKFEGSHLKNKLRKVKNYMLTTV